MRVFISYSHQDKAALDRLHVHLKNLLRQSHIETWYDRDILAGSELDAEIERELEAADLFLLMISSDFIASDYCVEREMKRALERQANGNARVVPIIVGECDWKAMSELRQIKAVPSDGKAISEWANSEAAYVDVVQELRRIIETEKPPAPAGKAATASFHIPDFFVKREPLNKNISEFLDQVAEKNIAVVSGPSGSGKTTTSVKVCMNNKWRYHFLESEFKREPDCGPFDVVIIDNLFSTGNNESDVQWMSRIDSRRIIVTTCKPGAYEFLSTTISESNVNIKEFLVYGLPEELFAEALYKVCCQQKFTYCDQFAYALFRHTGGLPIAIYLVYELASNVQIDGKTLSSLSDYCSIDKLANQLRTRLAREDSDLYEAMFALANVPRFALSTSGLARILDWTRKKANCVVNSLITSGLARYALPSSESDYAIRIHDILADCFAAKESESAKVLEMKIAHCAYWEDDFASESPVTMLDSLVVSSELLFSGHGSEISDKSLPKISEKSFIDGLNVMVSMSNIIHRIVAQTNNMESFPQFSDWISKYVRDNYRCMTCSTVIPLALFCLRLPKPDEAIGEAFSLFWSSCAIDDPTIVAPAVAVSALHLGVEEKDRFRSALERIGNWRMDQRELVAAALANALARFGDHEYATYFVSGHNTGGIDCSEALAGILLALEQRGDAEKIKLFKYYHSWRCHDIDPVTAAFLRGRIGGGIGTERFGEYIEINMDRVVLLAKLFSHSEFEIYAESLLRKSNVISKSPSKHRVELNWIYP